MEVTDDYNASIIAIYMVIMFIGIFIILMLILYNNYKSGDDIIYVFVTLIFIAFIFVIWSVYYNKTGKPYILYNKDTVNMKLQHLSFLLMIVFFTYMIYIWSKY